MFKVEIDYNIYFSPLMDDKGGGIVLTREIELPFVPFVGLNLHGKGVHETIPPSGLEVEQDNGTGSILTGRHGSG